MLRRNVVAEVPASRRDLRKWVEIIPQADGTFVIYCFEVSATLDPDRYIGPADLTNESSERCATVDDVLGSLESLGLDSETFRPPWETDFPG